MPGPARLSRSALFLAAMIPATTTAQQADGDWAASAREVEWARQHAEPLRTDEPGSDEADLAVLEPIVAGARVVSLGDGTHGSHEFFRLKDRLIRWLIERHGATVLAVEAGLPEAERVNEYVLTGRGDPREALAGLGFWTWSVEEMLPLLDWMRDYNASGRGRVEFRGVDMQRPGMAADSVRAFVARTDPASLPAVDSAYTLARSIWSDAERSRDPEQARIWKDAAGRVVTLLEASGPRYRGDPAALDLAIRHAHIVVQAAASRVPGDDSRDRSMAANAQWLIDRLPDGARMVIWAHNVHVNRAEGWMGEYLAATMGDSYRPIAFAFGEGGYIALGTDGLGSHIAAAPPVGTVEQGLRAVGLPRFVIDLRATRGVPEAQWLVEPRPFRHIGSRATEEPYRPNPVAENFDALIFIDRVTATKPLEGF